MSFRIFSKANEYRLLFRKFYYQQNIPSHIQNNFLPLNTADLKFIQRFESHRYIEIPWLDSVKPLNNSKILEIGCGNGTSTLALAEQGAWVTAIDVDNTLLEEARARCEIHGLQVEFLLMNASETAAKLSGREFDIIIFWAVLEHMTIGERIQAIKDTFEMLQEGGLWCIIGTPNRLYFFDSHTSNLPFFHWLPDELALKYAVNSSRQEYVNCFKNLRFESEEMLHFYRWGRGVSFHELELALKPVSELRIISSLHAYFLRKGLLHYLLSKFYLSSQFERYLSKKYPTINRCFFKPYLNLIIQKEKSIAN